MQAALPPRVRHVHHLQALRVRQVLPQTKLRRVDRHRGPGRAAEGGCVHNCQICRQREVGNGIEQRYDTEVVEIWIRMIARVE